MATIDSAENGSDYLGVDNLVVSLPPGTFEGHIECTNISIIDDDLFEQEEQETFTVNLDYSLNPSSFTGDFAGNITIMDNDGQILLIRQNKFAFYYRYSNYNISDN